MQTKLESFMETLFDVGSGFIISMLLMQFIVNPLDIGVQVSLQQNFIVTFIFTVASLSRKYIVRRLANYFKHGKKQQ